MQNDDLQGFPLSPQQLHLWSLDPSCDPNTALRTHCTVAVTGSLDTDDLRRVVADLVARHEILRTSFHRLPGLDVPVQVIADDSTAVIEVHDLGAVEATALDAEVLRLEEVARSQPLDLLEGRPLRLDVFRLSPSQHRLLFQLPTLTGDRSSLVNLVREIARGLGGEAEDEETLQYADLAEWQNELLRSEETREGREYWSSLDLSLVTGSRLPTERVSAEAFEPCRVPLELAPESREQLAALARDGDVSEVLLTAWTAFLGRITGLSRLLLGVTLDGRKFEELQQAQGLFERSLPIPLSLSGGPLAAARGAVVDALGRAHKLQEQFSWELVPAGLGEHPPFIPFGFDYRGETAAAQAGERVFNFLELACGRRFTVELACEGPGERLAAELGYDAGALDPANARRLARQFETFLASLGADPDASLTAHDLLDEEEHRRVLVELNRSPVVDPGERSLHQLIEARAAATPEAPAVLYEDQELSYGELLHCSQELARRLRRRGIDAGTPVAILLERSPEMVVAILAVLKAGGAYVPLDPAYPRERLAFVLTDTRAPLVLTVAAHQDALPSDVDVEVLRLDSDEAEEESTEPLPAAVEPGQLAYVIYTSGSTGRPKGVMVSHHNAVHSALARTTFYERCDGRFLLLSSYAFDSSVAGIFGTLSAGGTLVLSPESLQGEPEQLVQLIADRRVSAFLTLPSLYTLLLEQAEEGGGDLSSLDTVIVAGEACPPELVRRHERLLPEVALFNEYGPTEGTVWSSVYDCRQLGERSQVPIGSPIANTAIYVLDRGLRPLPGGSAGELLLAGTGLARGYLDRPALTAERFIPHPFSEAPGERLYRTGDLGCHGVGGVIEFLGRVDHQVKIRGFRIELGEVESALNASPGVRECVVVSHQDGAGRRLVAYVVFDGEPQATAVEDLRASLGERLPLFMVPALFVPLAGLPLQPNGKVDRRALPSPDDVHLTSGADYVAPRDDTERALAAIWAGVLGVERVGVHDRFFSLGGDSILAIQAVSKAHREGLEMTPQELFRYQTIAELTAAVDVRAAARITAEQGPVVGEVPLTPIQHWFFELDVADPHHWNQSLMLETPAELPDAVLEAALGEVLAHHDALRACFERRADGWHQFLAEPGDAPPFQALHLPADDSRATALETAVSEAQASLDLAAGPLLNVVRFHLDGEAADRLLLAVHHLVVDGISWRVFLEDLGNACRQALAGEPIALPPKTHSFLDWAKRLTAYARQEDLVGQLDEWLALLPSEAPGLPRDEDGGANLVETAVELTVELDGDTTDALLREAPKLLRAELPEILLTALARALVGWTGSSSVLVDLEGHGRDAELFAELDLSRTVGWFTAAWPALLSPGTTDAVPEASLAAVKESLRSIPGKGISYGILRYLDTGSEASRLLGRLPRPEVSFNYLGQLGGRIGEGSPFRVSREAAGSERSSRGERSHLLQVNVMVQGGKLRASWTYSRKHHHEATITDLAQGFLDELSGLVERARAGASAAAPSDFALADLAQGDLDALQSALEAVDDDGDTQ